MDRKTHPGKIVKVTREHHSHSNTAPEAFLNVGDLTDEELKLDSEYFDRIEAERAEDAQNHHHGKLIRKKKRGHSRHHRSHSKKKTKTGLIIAGAIILAIILALIALMIYMFGGLNHEDLGNVDAAVNRDDYINIALFGIDTDDPEGAGRSDSIMIFTIDTKRDTARLCSIMRDSYVEIEGHGKDKINHAYAFGGPTLAVKTLNRNFDLNITGYAAVNFATLPQIVDALGGVDIQISLEEAVLNAVPGITTAGSHHLNGEQALAYSRLRHASGDDFKRTERQRNVMTALLKKLLVQPSTAWPGIANKLAPMVTTGYSSAEILMMTARYGSSLRHGLKTARFPVDDTCQDLNIDGVYYLSFDIADQTKRIHDFVYNAVVPETTR